MLHTHSNEFKHHANNLKQVLKKYHDDTGISDLYLTSHCKKVVLNKLTETELFGCGFTKVYHLKNINSYLHLERIVIVCNVTAQEFKQIDEIQYLFPKMYMLTLSTTVGEQMEIIKGSKFKKSIKEMREVNLNFHTYLDQVYFLKEMEKSSLLKSQEEKNQPYKYERQPLSDRIIGYRSLLMSYAKIYQYEIYSVQNSNEPSYNQQVSTLKDSLQSSLTILSSHQEQCSSYYDQMSSPKIKCLILNRQIINDFISPLIYGYFYGPLTEQCINRDKLIEGKSYLTSKGKMFNILFQKDFNEAADYITSITKDKTLLQGKFQTNYFYKAKHIIASYQDPSPIEIALHISVWIQSRQYGINRLKAAAIQQDLANRIDEVGRKISNSKALSKIKSWMIEATQQQEKFITEEQLIKLGIIAEITGNLWFFHDSSLKKLFDTEENKNKFRNFLQRKQSIITHKLQQKPQPEEEQRSQLYRHEPKLLKICQKWICQTLGIQGSNNRQLGVKFQKHCINNDVMRNRDSRLVIIIDGMVGYNEIALFRKMVKSLTDKQVAICAQSLCNSQQYAEYLTRPVSKNKNNIR